MEMFILAIYVLVVIASAVAACSAHRYRAVRDANEQLTYGEMIARHSDRNDRFGVELLMSFFWPAVVVLWLTLKAVRKFYSLASRPGEIKARRDILTEE